jgi:superfamily II DNA or RNA helicase
MEGPTVLFLPSVFAAQGAAEYLTRNYGVEAVCVYGTQPEQERRENLAAFKSGQAKVLTNCAVVAVGFDFPPTQTLIMGRVTKSRPFWVQCAGRAARALTGTVDFPNSTPESRRAAIAASAKPHFKIVDCTTSSVDHTLVTAVDMFVTGDAAHKNVVKKQLAALNTALTPEQLAELAEREKARAEEEARKRLAAEQMAAYRKSVTGRAVGNVRSEEIDIQRIEDRDDRSIGTYRNPLRGKYAGVQLSQLPWHYLTWGVDNTTLSGWIRALYRKEMTRRYLQSHNQREVNDRRTSDHRHKGRHQRSVRR